MKLVGFEQVFRGLDLLPLWGATDPSKSSTLQCKWANQSVAFASSDWGLTTTWLCSIKTHAIFSDFRYFQAGSVDFELIVDKRWFWDTFKSDTPDSMSFEGDLRSLPFQDQTLKSVTLCSGLDCSPVLIPSWTPQSLTSTANITCASLSLQETLRPCYVNCGYSRLIWVTYSY